MCNREEGCTNNQRQTDTILINMNPENPEVEAVVEENATNQNEQVEAVAANFINMHQSTTTDDIELISHDHDLPPSYTEVMAIDYRESLQNQQAT